ncbi:hypothetical protein ACHAW5_004218 [Stephanodiscus triporus]|uniref:Uncharacterized protein n=1 Tax=Stephanodiscus triporus TaxID=2934178 RepID=A0ABD3NQ43_9STRA
MARRRRFLADRTATVIVVVRLLLALLSSSIPPFVAAQSFACVNTPDWKDLYGDTCVYYSSGPDRCEIWGGKVTGTPTISSMPSFDYDDPQAWNHGTYAVASEKGENVEVKLPPATMVGDTLFLFVSRTDAYMSIRLDGWTTGASCFKTYNDQPTCLLASDCVEKDGDDCLRFQGDGIAGGGYDLGTVLFHRRVTEDDLLSGTLQTFVEGTDNRRTWAIVTAITNVNQQSPIRAAAGTACDEDSDSVFPSVYGKDNDVLLLSQSFDDTASRDDFLPPDGTFLLGRAISRDEFGILFGEKLDRSGETAKRVTGGQGGSKCKDALLAIVVNRGK